MDNIRLEDVKKDLVKLANHLDGIKKTKEADFVDKILNKLGQEIPAKPVMDGDLLPNLSWPIVLEALSEALKSVGVDETTRDSLVKCLGINTIVIDEIPTNLLTEFVRCAKESGLAGELLTRAEEAVEALVESIGSKLGEKPMTEGLEDLLESGAGAASKLLQSLTK